MAKFRMIYTEFWTDPKVIEEMTPEDKYFFLYILTNPNTTQIGIYEITRKQVAFDMGYSLESVKSLFDRFINHHKIMRYNDETRELAIKNWGKFNLNRGGKPVLDCVRAELKVVKDISLIEYVAESIEKEDIKALYESYYESLDESRNESITISGQEEEEEEEEEKEEKEDLQLSCKDDESLKFSETSIEINLARFMIDKLLQIKPDSKVLDKDVDSLQGWAQQIDYMIRLDNRNPKDIKELFEWAQEDGFWCANIRSPRKLREKWDSLELQRNRNRPKVSGNISKLEEMYERARAEEEGV